MLMHAETCGGEVSLQQVKVIQPPLTAETRRVPELRNAAWLAGLRIDHILLIIDAATGEQRVGAHADAFRGSVVADFRFISGEVSGLGALEVESAAETEDEHLEAGSRHLINGRPATGDVAFHQVKHQRILQGPWRDGPVKPSQGERVAVRLTIGQRHDPQAEAGERLTGLQFPRRALRRCHIEHTEGLVSVVRLREMSGVHRPLNGLDLRRVIRHRPQRVVCFHMQRRNLEAPWVLHICIRLSRVQFLQLEGVQHDGEGSPVRDGEPFGDAGQAIVDFKVDGRLDILRGRAIRAAISEDNFLALRWPLQGLADPAGIALPRKTLAAGTVRSAREAKRFLHWLERRYLGGREEIAAPLPRQASHRIDHTIECDAGLGTGGPEKLVPGRLIAHTDARHRRSQTPLDGQQAVRESEVLVVVTAMERGGRRLCIEEPVARERGRQLRKARLEEKGEDCCGSWNHVGIIGPRMAGMARILLGAGIHYLKLPAKPASSAVNPPPVRGRKIG